MVEQPLLFELFFKLFIGEVERSYAVGLHIFDDNLVSAARCVKLDSANAEHLLTVFRLKTQALRLVLEHHG